MFSTCSLIFPKIKRVRDFFSQEMYNYTEMLDLSDLYSNDIHAMAHNYGIEAACNVLITVRSFTFRYLSFYSIIYLKQGNVTRITFFWFRLK